MLSFMGKLSDLRFKNVETYIFYYLQLSFSYTISTRLPTEDDTVKDNPKL